MYYLFYIVHTRHNSLNDTVGQEWQGKLPVGEMLRCGIDVSKDLDHDRYIKGHRTEVEMIGEAVHRLDCRWVIANLLHRAYRLAKRNLRNHINL